MNKFDEILAELAKRQPALDDPDALCDTIMQSLPDKSPLLPIWLNWVRNVSSLAAAVLLALFIYQSVDAEDYLPETQTCLVSASSRLRNIKTESDFREYLDQMSTRSKILHNHQILTSWNR